MAGATGNTFSRKSALRSRAVDLLDTGLLDNILPVHFVLASGPLRQGLPRLVEGLHSPQPQRTFAATSLFTALTVGLPAEEASNRVHRQWLVTACGRAVDGLEDVCGGLLLKVELPSDILL